MKIIEVAELALPEIKVVRYARFRDNRGYFTETFRKSDFNRHPEAAFLRNVEFTQTNESFSLAGTVRGMHFQWNPYMAKLIRTLQGRMVDLVLDVRKGSPTFGKIIAHDMPANRDQSVNEWIWVPPGFAHGNFFLEDTTIEYFCTGEYSPGCEAGISPLATDLDWSLCNEGLRKTFQQIAATSQLISEKDKNGFSVSAWAKDERANLFLHPDAKPSYKSRG